MNSSNNGISTLTLANITALKDENGHGYALACNTGTYGTGFADVLSFHNSGGVAFRISDNASSTGTQDVTFADLGVPNGSSEEICIDAALRSGKFAIASIEDEFSQTSTKFWAAGGAANYEILDWRTVPQIADELYSGDDVDAENKYDQTINEINAQDKKLQLEQTSIEVEYKAITSEKDSVKKVLDTNASSSFKYFS